MTQQSQPSSSPSIPSIPHSSSDPQNPSTNPSSKPSPRPKKQLAPADRSRGYSPALSGTRWTLREKLRCKTLYLSNSLTTNEIARAIGRTQQAVEMLIYRSGWARQLVANRKDAESLADAEIDRRLRQDIASTYDAIAGECEEIALGGLTAAREALDDRDARSFALYAGGVKGLAGIARQVRASDPATSLVPLGSSSPASSINVFLSPLQHRADPRPVEPVESSHATVTV